MKLLSYPLTIIYYVFFGLTLVIFHPIQWICLKIGYSAHKFSVDSLQFSLMRCLNILGTRYSFENKHTIPKGQPLIIVANHQSMYDISPLIMNFRRHHPKFISKKELGKGIPSISLNLRHGDAALIDRNDPKQAITEIIKFAKNVHAKNYSAVIFPEGTRSKDGNPKPFKTKGLVVLFKYIPNAIIVPVTINNSWKTIRYGKFPMGLGTHIKLKAHAPITLSDYTKKEYPELIEEIEKTITSAIVVA